MRYFLIAGEASGDLHGGNLVRGLLAVDPEAEIRAWGGEKMAEAGAEILHDYRGSDIMSPAEILRKGGGLLRNISDCKHEILSWKPDAVVLIDYPGFNMKIARFAHSHGFKVFYYIPPKTWASRSGRNKALRRDTDALFIVFPFEKTYFDSVKVPYIYEGNPLVDAIDAHEFRPVSHEPYLALLPGSRMGEITRMMPVCLQVAESLGVKVIVAGAPSRRPEDYEPFVSGHPGVEVIFGRTYDIVKGARAAIVNSGTASLETALLGTPQVVCWSTSVFNAFVGRKILRILDHIKYISLGNLILDKLAFRELVQEDFNVPELTAEVRRLLDDEAARTAMQQDYRRIRELLGGGGASRRVAAKMFELLADRSND